jgi:hypothetical protein
MQGTQNLLEMQLLLLRCRLGDLGFVDILQLGVRAAPPCLAYSIDRQVVQDGKDPRPCVAVRPTLILAGNNAFQAILHQVIGGGPVVQLGACVPAKRRNQWLDHEPHVVHDNRPSVDRSVDVTPGGEHYSRRSHFLALV